MWSSSIYPHCPGGDASPMTVLLFSLFKCCKWNRNKAGEGAQCHWMGCNEIRLYLVCLIHRLDLSFSSTSHPFSPFPSIRPTCSCHAFVLRLFPYQQNKQGVKTTFTVHTTAVHWLPQATFTPVIQFIWTEGRCALNPYEIMLKMS